MNKRTIKAEEIPNHQYHHEFPDYISSTTLKKYRISTLHFQAEMEKDHAESEALLLGTLWHDMIAAKHPSGKFNLDEYVIFQPKINDKTGKPYGDATKEQSEHRLQFVSENDGKTIVSQTAWDTASIMVENIFSNPDHVSYDFFMKAFNNGVPEVSYFIDEFYEDVNIRIRPDLDLPKAILDYKSFGYPIDQFPSKITELGYDISAAMYVEGKLEFYRRNKIPVEKIMFYWIVQESKPPYDWAIFSAENYLESGAKKFYTCLLRHKHRLQTNRYEGIASTCEKPNGIFKPEPSPWQKQLNRLL